MALDEIPLAEHARVIVDTERCVGCEDCIVRCPTEALSLDTEAWVAQGNDVRCVGCRQCERVCAFGAITVEGPVVVTPSLPRTPHHPQQLEGDIHEVQHGFSSREEALVEASRCLDCPDPTCVRGCPAHNDIPGFLRALRDDDLTEAHEVLRHTSVLPDVCSRVCDWRTQCEGACTWALAGSQPVAIGRLERYLTEAAAVPPLAPEPMGAAVGLRVAIAGAGPAGLAAAWELLHAGAKVTVFEAAERPGGVLRWGIPSYVLPDAIIARPLDALVEAGMDLRTGVRVGSDVSVAALLEEHDAVVLAYGASAPIPLQAPGTTPRWVEDASTFLSAAKAALAEGQALPELEGAHILVVGAGNTAMDVARSARRLGAQATAIDWMDRRFARVRPDELAEAAEEGVDIRFCTTLEALEPSGDTDATATAVLRPTRQRHASARPHPLHRPVERLVVHRVVAAMGYRVETQVGTQLGVSLPHRPQDLSDVIQDRLWLASGLPQAHGTPVPVLARSREAAAIVASTPVMPGVWVIGDASQGPATVVEAMAQGRDVAREIVEHAALLRGLASRA